ncbi:class I SAM-dependent methyltransferase [Paenibacillus sp. LHD-117]|uniref:class I SAM-dependent methyltransferase n=1 Tax=Paenibacillus sp. LHD-117 TaxID=3071412 RepID=UPI0027DFDE46|nr:class I SAM-dependent methyltransferase [Paenibacillus sp. LHD-117]MDQ6422076.1 class I SAM-dependent methyltransferase [Paenibacillus sp. LHD-117]
MSNHYYSKAPEMKHNRQTVETLLKGQKLKFVTDAGVFSKAGVDYGSKVLIDAMELGEADRVLDVGCGYGPIGLTAAKLVTQGRVTMIDINERAVELAKENAGLNGIRNVNILQSDLFSAVTEKEYDVILTNPPIRAGKAVVHRIFEEGYAHLREGGYMWVVIQKKQGAPSAKEKLELLFGEVTEVTKDKGYRIFRAKK